VGASLTAAGGAALTSADSVPPASVEEAQGIDPSQSMNVYVHPRIEEPNYIYGPQAGVGLPLLEASLGTEQLAYVV
jgi:hypothetical protein